MERKRLKYIDGIRFFAVLLVVIDHFNASLMQFNITIWGKSYIIPSTFANETLGILGVSLFFIISGVSLYYNYVNEFNIKTYFKKRFLNIYPTFWCYYLLVFLILFFRNKAFWFETTKTISTNRFLLSILGMDGFFYIREEIFI